MELTKRPDRFGVIPAQTCRPSSAELHPHGTPGRIDKVIEGIMFCKATGAILNDSGHWIKNRSWQGLYLLTSLEQGFPALHDRGCSCGLKPPVSSRDLAM